jgi:predicted DNA-binding transcriptional regulator YafY
VSAEERFARIVSIVAELSRAERDGEDAASIQELAEQHGVTPRDITADIRTLTILGDRSADADWLLSLRIWQQEDRVSITSEGPFRRPIRLSPEEQLAIQLALAMDPAGESLARRLASFWNDGPRDRTREPGSPKKDPTLEAVRRATRDHLALEIQYAAEVRRDLSTRTIFPHQVAESGVRTYVVAWAEDVGAWRHFRLDRILSAAVTERRFEPRADFEPMQQPRDSFRPRIATDRVTVRFRSEVAPWVTEFYAGHETLGDGSVLVHFDASSKEWLVRRVLEFGEDAEVVDPREYRDAVRRAVA